MVTHYQKNLKIYVHPEIFLKKRKREFFKIFTDLDIFIDIWNSIFKREALKKKLPIKMDLKFLGKTGYRKKMFEI